MASDDQWPPVTSTGRGTPKVNCNKRNTMESQQYALLVANEMFGSALEKDVIRQVVQNCNWDLQPAIENLITLTETVDSPSVWNSVEKIDAAITSAPAVPTRNSGLRGGNPEIMRTESSATEAAADRRSSDITSKWEKPKRGGTKNRMGSFCGNIAKLKSSSMETNPFVNAEPAAERNAHKQRTAITTNDDILFDGILNYGASANVTVESTESCSNPMENSASATNRNVYARDEALSPSLRPNLRTCQSSSSKSFSPPMKKDTSKKQKFVDTKAAAEDKEFNKPQRANDNKTMSRKSESESLCGLKVQYRIGGMETSSDDDADVVIEDESSDYKVDLASSVAINVSQFLSPSTQTAPRRTQPKLQTMSTPSPPQTPRRNAHAVTLDRIKSSVTKGHKIMILLRGLPGSGKTTLARSIVATTIGGNPTSHVFNTDDFFVTLGRGVYHYDPSRLQEAHNTNHKRVCTAAKEGRSPIIVDNTNIEAWEMRPYLSMAVQYGYIIEIIEPDTPWSQNVNQLAKKNAHNVPKSKIREKLNRYERVDNVQSLLDRYSLKYSVNNNPPQMRRVPKLQKNLSKSTMDDIKSNWDNHGKNNYVLTSHDIESMQNIDETHSFVNTMSELASVPPDSPSMSNLPEKSKTIDETSYDDYLQQLQNSGDESFEIVDNNDPERCSRVIGKSIDDNVDHGSRGNLSIAKDWTTKDMDDESSLENDDSSNAGSQKIFGAIGSERKGSLSMSSSICNLDYEKLESKQFSSNESQSSLGAIGSERKGSSSVGSSVINLAIDKNDGNESSDCQQSLGAIGSERKGSFSHISVGSLKNEVEKSSLNVEDKTTKVDDNVLSQCWDFTLILGRLKIHSKHSIKDLPQSNFCSNVNKLKNERSHENLRENCVKIDDKINVEDVKINDEICKVEGVTITEIYDDTESQIDPIDDSHDESFDTDDMKRNLLSSSVENDDESEFDSSELKQIENLVRIASTLSQSERTIDPNEIKSFDESSDSPINEFTPEIPTLHEIVEKTEDNEKSQTNEISNSAELNSNATTTAFGTFFNMLKTSILGTTEESSINDLKNDEIPNLTLKSTNYEMSKLSSNEKSPSLETESTTSSSDTVDSPGASNETSETDSSPEIPSKDSKTIVNVDDLHESSTNPFTMDIIKLQRENPVPTNVEIVNDNINSITWKESPFPIDSTKIPQIRTAETAKIVEKTESSTNTSYYDFNVVYVGGTSESGYREIYATSRCINEATTIKPKIDGPPLKLMLDKSSLTDDLNSMVKKDERTIDDGLRKLVELFSGIPIKDLETFYKQQCKCDFDWALAVLLEGGIGDFTIEDSNLKFEKIERNDDSKNETTNVPESNEKFDGKIVKSQNRTTKNRRQRSKDFRCFSYESVDDRSSGSGENFTNDDDPTTSKDEEEIVLSNIDDRGIADESDLPCGNDEISVASENSMNYRNTEITDDDGVDDVMEIDFGRDFVDRLEKTFGNADFSLPDEFNTVVRIKKSMAEKLHGLWIQSMYEQLTERHAKLDEMIAKDEEMARALDREETVQPTEEPEVPNLEEIMAMEMALASYENELKAKITRETPNDMASRLKRQKLCESWPDLDPQILSELLKAHGGNFEETCKTIETSTDRTISGKTVSPECQQGSMDRVKQDSQYRKSSENLENFDGAASMERSEVNASCRIEQSGYKDALTRVQDARKEAQKQFSLHIENYNKAAAAYGRGHPGIAAYYSRMAKLHSENSRAAQAEASDAHVLAQIYCTDNEDTLDMHSMCVSEALRAFEMFVEFHAKKLVRSNKKSSSLRIITGRGARSNNGFSKIKPAICKRLTSRNIRFVEENPGCLKVTLSRKNCTTE